MTIRAGLGLAVLLLAAFARAATPDAAVHAAWAELDAAWNARDAARFSSTFGPDASFEFVDRGQALESRQAIHDSFAARFPTFAPALRHRTTVREVRRLADGIAAVDGDVHILRVESGDGAAPAVLKHFAIFAVMQQRGERWHIELLRAYELPLKEGG